MSLGVMEGVWLCALGIGHGGGVVMCPTVMEGVWPCVMLFHDSTESESRGTTPTSQGPVEPEKPIQLPNGIKGDFAGAIRQELSKEHKGHKEHFGVLEVSVSGLACYLS